MKYLPILPALILFGAKSIAQFPQPDTPKLAISNKLEIVWKYSSEEPINHYNFTNYNSHHLREKNSTLLPDSSLVIGYLNTTRDTFKLTRINPDGSVSFHKEFTGNPNKGRYFSINPDPNNNIVVVIQTESSNDGKYDLILGRLSTNLDLIEYKILHLQKPAYYLDEPLVDAIVLDNGTVVVAQLRQLHQTLYDFGGPPGYQIISLATIENSAVILRFFDSTGNNYTNKIFPPDLNFNLSSHFGIVLETRNVQLKSLVKGTGGNFYAQGVNYSHYDDIRYYTGEDNNRIEDFVYKFSANGNIERTKTFSSPLLFSDLQPVSEYTFGIGATFSGDSLVAVDRDLNLVPGYGFSLTLPPADSIHTSRLAYERQFRFHPESSIYTFLRNADISYEKYDFQGNRIWSSTDSSSLLVPEIQRIQNITPLGNKQFLLEGYDFANKLTLLKLREKELITTVKVENKTNSLRGKIQSSNITVNENLRIFPNPVNDWLNVAFPDAFTGAVTITINDYTGRLLKTERINASSTTRLDVSSLKPGYYFLVIYNRKGDHLQGFFIKLG